MAMISNDKDLEKIIFSDSPTLLEFVRLKQHMAELLDLKVDLVMKCTELYLI